MKNKLNIIQLRKKRWNGYTWADVIKLLNIHLPKCDYTSIIELDKRISNLLSIPKKYVTEVRLSTFKLPNNIKWENEKNYFNSLKKKIEEKKLRLLIKQTSWLPLNSGEVQQLS